MEPTDFKQEVADVYGQTTLHPIGLAAVLLLGVAMVILPRKYAVLPMFIMACFVSPAQRIVIASFDFDLLRVMVLFGWMRLVARGELRMINWRWIDLSVLIMAVVGTVTMVMLHGTREALVNRLGWAYDLLGMYYLFRFLIRDWKTFETTIVGMAVVAIPVALFFMVEWSTGRNVFGMFGGVPEITSVRDGRLRCQGAFAHPILAGSFWAALLPLVGALWWRGGNGKNLAVAGVGATLFIIFACSSSTPVMGIVFVLVGVAMFAFRHWMMWIAISGFGGVVFLDLVMNKPFYHLIARINIFSSSTGWHRFKLIDEAVKHFDEWWAMGIISTWHWGVLDITNQYILIGIRGGAFTLLAFLLIMVAAYGMTGKLWRSVDHDRYRLAMSWAIAVSLFVHTMTFISVSYFGQIEVIWYMLLASIAGLAPMRVPAAVQGPVAARRASVAEHNRMAPAIEGGESA